MFRSLTLRSLQQRYRLSVSFLVWSLRQKIIKKDQAEFNPFYFVGVCEIEGLISSDLPSCSSIHAIVILFSGFFDRRIPAAHVFGRVKTKSGSRSTKRGWVKPGGPIDQTEGQLKKAREFRKKHCLGSNFLIRNFTPDFIGCLKSRRKDPLLLQWKAAFL